MSTPKTLLSLVIIAWTGICCSKKAEMLASFPFSDNFDRQELGQYYQGNPAWHIKDGQVFSTGTKNQPLWLSLKLPADVVIEFDARSESPAGDIKFEIFGDGKNHESGYILIFGGWNNKISCIARLDEHGADRQELKKPEFVKIGKVHHMKVVRQGKVMRWYVDNKLLLDYFDSSPLKGPGHDRMAFNNWNSHLYFDNLEIRPATPNNSQ
jgi:hypothetical protein